jgi:hypothetical protein
VRAIDGAFGTGGCSGPAGKAHPRLDPTLLVNAKPSVVVEGSNPLDGRLVRRNRDACGVWRVEVGRTGGRRDVRALA